MYIRRCSLFKRMRNIHSMTFSTFVAWPPLVEFCESFELEWCGLDKSINSIIKYEHTHTRTWPMVLLAADAYRFKCFSLFCFFFSTFSSVHAQTISANRWQFIWKVINRAEYRKKRGRPNQSAKTKGMPVIKFSHMAAEPAQRSMRPKKQLETHRCVWSGTKMDSWIEVGLLRIGETRQFICETHYLSQPHAPS